MKDGMERNACRVGRPDSGYRSEPGYGGLVRIHVMGRADQFADDVVWPFGKISAGCGPNLGEDFSTSRWPVVVKVKREIPNSELVQHLRDLADAIQGFLDLGGADIEADETNTDDNIIPF